MLTIAVADDVNGQGLTNILLKSLDSHKWSVENIVGQGYDGGSNMMGACKGV